MNTLTQLLLIIRDFNRGIKNKMYIISIKKGGEKVCDFILDVYFFTFIEVK